VNDREHRRPDPLLPTWGECARLANSRALPRVAQGRPRRHRGHLRAQPSDRRGVYEGYRNKLRHEEWRDGIRVIRLWTFLAANQGFARRAAAHAEETYDRRVLATRFERIMASLLPDVRASERCTFA
jgi:hypothetical protein